MRLDNQARMSEDARCGVKPAPVGVQNNATGSRRASAGAGAALPRQRRMDFCRLGADLLGASAGKSERQ